jgi:hypothetical protein
MSNWLRIGLPILIAVLLVVTAVSVTLAVTSTNGGAGIGLQPAAGTQYATGPYCWGYARNAINGQGYAPGTGYGCPAWRWN